MNVVLNFFKIYIHMTFIIIYLQMKCFRNFPTVLLQFQLFASMQEKNCRFIMTIFCDYVES